MVETEKNKTLKGWYYKNPYALMGCNRRWQSKMSPLRGSGSLKLWQLQKYHPFGVQGSGFYVQGSVALALFQSIGWQRNPEENYTSYIIYAHLRTFKNYYDI
jgi:hypothetical protein